MKAIYGQRGGGVEADVEINTGVLHLLYNYAFEVREVRVC